MALKSMISCEALTLPTPFDGACFGHAMSKVAQYAINDNEISKYLMPNFIMKYVEIFIQACITWQKELGMSTQFSIFIMQTFTSCEIYNKTDVIPFSLYTISKGVKEWT